MIDRELHTEQETRREARPFEAQLAELLAVGKLARERLIDPIGLRSVLYLFFAVIFFGGLGSWTTAVFYTFGLATTRDLAFSLATYSLAICIVAFIDALLDKKSSDIFSLIMVGIVTVTTGWTLYVSCLLILSEIRSDALPPKLAAFVAARAPEPSFTLIVTWLLPVWVVWWIASAADPRLAPRPASSQAAGGGPAMAKLKRNV